MKVALRLVCIRVDWWLNVVRSQADNLSGMDVVARANLLEQLFTRRVVEIQNCQRSSTFLISAQRHGRDVYVVLPKQCSNATYHSRSIGVFENKNDAVRAGFDWSTVHAHNPRSRAEKCAADRNNLSFSIGGQLNQIGIIAGRAQSCLGHF